MIESVPAIDFFDGMDPTQMRYKGSPVDLVIRDRQPDTDIHFISMVRTYQKPFRQFIWFNYKTRYDANGELHPFFEEHRTADLASMAIAHFEAHNDIDGIEFEWGKPGEHPDWPVNVNYDAYMETRLMHFGEVRTKAAKKAAAMSTWTYLNVAMPAGYTEVSDVNEHPRVVSLIPWKQPVPDPTAIRGVFKKPR